MRNPQHAESERFTAYAKLAGPGQNPVRWRTGALSGVAGKGGIQVAGPGWDPKVQAFFGTFSAAFFLAAHRWRILSAAASRWAVLNFRRFFLAGLATSFGVL
jgi:hypothetical protein